MKTTLITGATGNLGQALAKQFAGAGYKVCGTGDLNGVPGYEGIKVDLSDEQAAGDWVAAVINQYHEIDTAILTVGGFAMGNIADTPLKNIKQQLQLNFDTAYNTARPVFLQMLKQGQGSLFFIGSQAGEEAAKNKGVLAYGLSKSLLFRLAAVMNEEAENSLVKVFVVVPFIIDTPQNRTAMPDADFSKWQSPAFIAETVFEYSVNPAGREALLKF